MRELVCSLLGADGPGGIDNKLPTWGANEKEG